MPHCIIEYSADYLAKGQAKSLLLELHQTIVDSGLFKPANIKLRLHPVEDYLVGGEEQPFLHTQLRIRPGRSIQQKKALSDAMLATIQGLADGMAVITVEVVDFDDDSYAKWQRP